MASGIPSGFQLFQAGSSNLPKIIIGGLGPGDADLIPDAVLKLVRTHLTFLRTRKHPCAYVFEDLDSFDHLYESQRDEAGIHEVMVEQLVRESTDLGTIGYLVPGSALIAERTVELLRQREEVSVEILPGVSFLDLVWERLQVDPIARNVSIVDAQAFGTEVTGLKGPLLVAQCDNRSALSGIKLSIDVEEPPKVTVLQRLGLEDEAVFEVEWENLDLGFEPDHLTSLWIPELPRSDLARLIVDLHALVRRLRSECPWDMDQTHVSLIPGLLEEANEVVEAIELAEKGEGSLEDLVEELGDLLFHIIMQSVIGEEEKTFDLADVAREVRNKMIRRHPHIFDRNSGSPMPTKEELVEQWQTIKAAERETETSKKSRAN